VSQEAWKGNPPKISVVTPSFNQGRFLEETLRSIHDQGYPNLEHIVIDGGSTDSSVAVIQQFADRLSYWVSEKDNGQTDALIKGFNRATGDIHCWLNSDDLFEPATLEEVAQFFHEHPEVRFIYGDSTWIDVDGRPFKPKREHPWNRFVWMFDHNFIPQPSAFWRSDLYHEVGGLDPTFDLAMDADLWIRFADVTRPRHVRRDWSRMRFYPEQKNTRMRAASGVEGRAIRSRYLSPASRRKSRARRIAARLLRVALKTSAGAYSMSEITRHAATLMGKGSWEQREYNRQRGTGRGRG
jgi:glycosyltransferase involved in cell wall biosynthesis